MRYWQSYRFAFTSPNWLTNLLLGSVCLLIPMIGQIVLIGYFFEVIDILLRRHRASAGAASLPPEALSEQVMDALPVDEDHVLGAYPDFSFNRFADYLTRGIWPFLVRFLVNLVVGVVAGLFLIVGFVVMGIAAPRDSAGAFLIIYALFWVVYAFVMMMAGILTTPLYLRAGLSGDFAGAFSMEFYRDFMKRVGKEVFLAEVFLAATGTLVAVVGLLLCYVGIFPAMALILYAHHHLEYQLYDLYLERGGVPVPGKKKEAARSERYDEEDITSPRVRRPPSKNRSSDVMRPEEEW